MSSLWNKLFGTMPTPKKEDIVSENQKKFIEEYAEKLLSSSSVNLKMVPDVMEKKMYIILLTIILSEMKESLEKTSIVILGHEITFSFKPIKPSEDAHEIQ